MSDKPDPGRTVGGASRVQTDPSWISAFNTLLRLLRGEEETPYARGRAEQAALRRGQSMADVISGGAPRSGVAAAAALGARQAGFAGAAGARTRYTQEREAARRRALAQFYDLLVGPASQIELAEQRGRAQYEAAKTGRGAYQPQGGGAAGAIGAGAQALAPLIASWFAPKPAGQYPFAMAGPFG